MEYTAPRGLPPKDCRYRVQQGVFFKLRMPSQMNVVALGSCLLLPGLIVVLAWLATLVDSPVHVTGERAVLPPAGVDILIEEHPRTERAHAGNGRIGQLNHGCVAGPLDCDDNRNRFVGATESHFCLEAPKVG